MSQQQTEHIHTQPVISVDGTTTVSDHRSGDDGGSGESSVIVSGEQWYDSAVPTAAATMDDRRLEAAVAYAVAAVEDEPPRYTERISDSDRQGLSLFNSPPASAAFRQERAQWNGYEYYVNNGEEEKEEITTLAGLPTGRVAIHTAEMATVMGNNNLVDDDAELAAMKRAAAYGGPDVHMMVPDKEPQPEPLRGEDFAAFYSRTIDHWNVLAAEKLTGSGGDLNLDTLEDESTRMASHRWQEMQPEMNAEATIVTISEGDVHPSDLAAIQAELVGPNYSAPPDVSAGDVGYVPNNENNVGGPVATAFATGDEDTTEATVIDSAPLAKEESQEAWQAAEEAQVLENVTSISTEDRKPPANETGSSVQREEEASRVHESQRDEYAVADQEGMVLAIEDDVHPSVFQRGDAPAQVVGADFAFAVEERSNQIDESPAAPVTPVTQSDNDPVESHAEVCAVIVEENQAVAVTADLSSTTIAEPEAVSVLPSEMVTLETNQVQDPPTKEVWSGPNTGFTASSGDATNDVTGVVDDDGTLNDIAARPPLSLPPTPPTQQILGSAAREHSTASGTSDLSSSSQRSQLQNLSSNIARSTGNVMGALFGDTKGPFVTRKTRASESDITDSIIPRTLLPWSVIFSPTNKMWVATLQTSQKALDSNNITEASKALRAFSLPTEKQAISLARAWTPPRMMSFSDNALCHVCHSRFAVFRRACHCRNCGVCVCKDCTVQWPSNMVPDTYNTKNENHINACRSCDWLSCAFRAALLNGNMDEAVAIHATGNINLTCAFSNVKGELFYPVHCAVMGGNIQLLKWLVDQQCCPIKSVRVSGKTRDAAGRYTPIVTSKGRSLLGIAMEHCYTQIIRYLVVEKGIVIAGERDITHEMLTRNMTQLLRALPDESSAPGATEDLVAGESPGGELAPAVPSEERPAVPDPDDNVRSLSDGARDFGAIYQHRDVHASTSENEECILCFDARIDCVATPCGHQICCLTCSKHVSRCPVCAQECSFMRVFKP